MLLYSSGKLCPIPIGMGFYVNKGDEPMKEKLGQIKLSALDCISECDGLADLEDIRIRFLGKKGLL